MNFSPEQEIPNVDGFEPTKTEIHGKEAEINLLEMMAELDQIYQEVAQISEKLVLQKEHYFSQTKDTDGKFIMDPEELIALQQHLTALVKIAIETEQTAARMTTEAELFEDAGPLSKHSHQQIN